MDSDIIQLRYLPLFYEDMEKVVDYIAYELRNPQAANDLIDAAEKAILERVPVAESFEPFQSLKERRYPYYRIYVKNYVVYYVSDSKIMEVRRFLYNKEDTKEKL